MNATTGTGIDVLAIGNCHLRKKVQGIALRRTCECMFQPH